MATEPNGSGRLDRVEALLAQMAERQATSTWLHEQHLADMEAAQVVFDSRQKQMQEEEGQYRAAQRERDALLDRRIEIERKRLDTLNETTDKRIADLVGAIGALISARAPKLQ